MPVLSRNEDDFYVPILGMKITPIDFDRFLFDDGGVVGAGFISQNKDKPPTLEMGVVDFLPKNKVVYAFEIFLFLILGLALIYSLYTIMRALVRRLRKIPLELKSGERTLMGVANLGLFLSFLYAAFNVLNFKSSRDIRLGFILCATFSIWTLIYLVRTIILFRGLKKNILSRRIFNTILCCIAMLLNSLYWQWFKFW